jgi:crotonobetainyl-CoA:carnitine CoA-transferase CaiB-like acyl-CoA transferase
MTGGSPPGPLADLRVVEIADEQASFAGKLVGDLGASVVKVEPPGGERSRSYAPFLDDAPHPDRSLFFWHYNTSKRSVTLDLDREEGRAAFRDLAAASDVVIESEPRGRLAGLGLDYAALSAVNPRLIMVSVSPFGSGMPRSDEECTDLTLLAGGGPAWSCGYDDHSLPPVRGGGNQGYQTACHFAVMGLLVAVVHRDRTGRGQHVDVNSHAAQNVTTEAATYQWLIGGQEVQRQTGRHAGVQPSLPSQVQCADGRWVNSGFPPRRGVEYQRIRDWILELGLEEEFPKMPLIEMGMEHERIDLSLIQTDPAVREIFVAGREAMTFLASKMDAYEFFSHGQARGFQVGIIYSPEEVLSDPHFIEREWPTTVRHPELGRDVTYPGRPYRFTASPWAITRRPPLLGEHTEEVLREAGLDDARIEALRSDGVS